MSKPGPSFLELSMNGFVALDDIDDFVDVWHDGDDDRELRDFLGFTAEEYKAWVEEPSLIAYIVTARREEKNFLDLVESAFKEYRIAARSETEGQISTVERWLKDHGKID